MLVVGGTAVEVGVAVVEVSDVAVGPSCVAFISDDSCLRGVSRGGLELTPLVGDVGTPLTGEGVWWGIL